LPGTEPNTDRAAVEVTMPETGSDDGALLISWFKAPGAAVEADEPICMVRVGDLTAEIVSPSAGVVGGIYAETGQQVPPGASLAEILPAPPGAQSAAVEPEPEPVSEPDPEPETEGDPEPDLPVFAEPALQADPEPATATGPEPQRELADPLANLASEIEALEIAVPDLELAILPAPALEPEPDPEPEPELELVAEPELEPPPPVDLATFRSPAVRRLAEQHGLDLDGIAGTGRDGRVTRDDILASL
jgi:pyruvate dehydrogenase E2 component (dihydrolipoamide acetyltransferase)